jgi:hypothetical protein
MAVPLVGLLNGCSGLTDSTKVEISRTLKAKVSSIESKLAQAEALADKLAAGIVALQTQKSQDREAYTKLTLETFQSRPNFVKGMGFFQGPFGIITRKQWVSDYFFVNPGQGDLPGRLLPAPNNNLRYVDENEPGDFYPEQDYYKNYVATQKRLWAPPYEYFGVLYAGFYAPLYAPNKKWMGAVSVDLLASSLQSEIKDPVLRGQGYFALLTKEGQIIAYPPNPSAALKSQTYTTIPGLSGVWNQLNTIQPGQAEAICREKTCWFREQIPRTQWIVLAVVPQ